MKRAKVKVGRPEPKLGNGKRQAQNILRLLNQHWIALVAV